MARIGSTPRPGIRRTRRATFVVLTARTHQELNAMRHGDFTHIEGNEIALWETSQG
jgi:hypothetical protein